MADDAAAAGGESQNVKVMMRVRPFNKRELAIQAKSKEPLQCVVRMRDNTCAIMDYSRDDRGFPVEKEREAFAFDECFWSLLPDQAICPGKPFADQKYVYERSGLLAMQAAFTGYNVCIFAYGQTGSGKTHSMLGSAEDPGISPRLCDDMFARIDKEKETRPVKVVVECLFFEIYNEKVRDLFNKKLKEGEYDAPKIRQHPMKGVYVEGLTRKEVTTSTQAKTLIEKGTKERAMAETKMNAHSSRSHAIFQIQLIQNDAMKGTQKVSNINLVDLAGSEKIKMSGVSGDALKEATNINQSLSTLRKVIDTLIENSGIKNKKNHRLPPFRESVLTYVLSDSLGGNSKTQMIATVSPHESNTDDTINTLRYALRAKAIVCNARVNEEKSAAMLDAMRDEILALQMKLREGPTGAADPRASEEIRKEIEAKENEMKQMEEQQQEMQGMLEQAKAKEVELTVAVTQQKKERFAAAFRNAFLLTTEKQKQATSKAESEALALEKAALEEQLKNVQRQLDETKQDLAETRDRADTDGARLSKELTDRELTITQLRKQLTLVTEESAFLRTQNEGLLGKVESAQNAQSDATRQMQRAQSELLAAIAAAEQAAHEAKTTKEELERRLASERDNGEQLRRRKDTYKQMYLQANAEGAARSTLLEAMREDRTTFVHTIRAQQAVVSEHSAAATRFADERREAHAKANTLQAQLTANEAQMRGMHDALREYQLAAAEFIFDNNTMQRELQRQQIGSPSAALAASGVGFAASPVAGIGGGSVAGYASPSPHRSGISVRATSPHVSVTGRHVDPLAGAGSPRRFY